MSFWTRLFRGEASKIYAKGIQHFNDGDFDQAVGVFESIIANSKGRESPVAKLGAFYAAEAHVKLGMAELHRSNLDKALHHLQTALNENSHRLPERSIFGPTRPAPLKVLPPSILTSTLAILPKGDQA